MNKTLIVIALFFTWMNGKGQEEKKPVEDKQGIITIGFLQGGGSLIGFDFERLVTKNIGIGVGFGFLGYGGALHYHIKPRANSSSIALNYWNQGMSTTYVQSLVGPSYVFRLKKLLSAQLGFGLLVQKGPKYNEAFQGKEYPVLLLYSIGMFF